MKAARARSPLIFPVIDWPRLCCGHTVTPAELRQWTFKVAVRTVRLVQRLPTGPRSSVLGRQLLRSSTSVAAQYRAACRAQSPRDFAAKMKDMEEEADESALWLALLRATGLSDPLRQEAEALEADFDRLTAIAVASIKTVRRRIAEGR
jgi:four helix bundle protein